MEKKNTGLGIASLVLGIIAVVFCFIPYINVISYIMGVLAIIFAIITLVNKKAKNALPIAGLILSVIALLIASTMNTATTEAIKETSKEIDKITGDSTEEVLKNDVEVTLGNFEVTTKEYGFTETQLVVTVKNITDKKRSYSLHVEAIDSEGQRIQDDYVTVNDLGPGQTTKEKIFQFVEDEKLPAMKNATFKIVEASTF